MDAPLELWWAELGAPSGLTSQSHYWKKNHTQTLRTADVFIHNNFAISNLYFLKETELLFSPTELRKTQQTTKITMLMIDMLL